MTDKMDRVFGDGESSPRRSSRPPPSVPRTPAPSVHATLRKEVAEADLTTTGRRIPPWDDTPPEPLPSCPPIGQRYFDFMRARGRDDDTTVRLGMTGMTCPTPGGSWMKCDAWQFASVDDVARVFVMRRWFAGVVPLVERDTYVRGHGAMRIGLFRYLPVVESENAEIARAELSSYLSEALMFLPGALRSRAIVFRQVDASSFHVQLSDRHLTVGYTVMVDDRGAIRWLTTGDRYMRDPFAKGRPWVPRRWSGTVRDWRPVHGRRIPTRVTATWNLPEGDFPYADLLIDPSSVAFNLASRQC